ncbi:hypothetical protein [uncultured Friedmanniella sp.]|uniref:hypothetical protein n=1 Tax=uncultured Friedmanniella sp. TaxID=335381 RepID=UPI0035CA2EFF
MGALLRWREPAVLVLLAAAAVRELLVVGLGLAALAGAVGPYGLATYAAAGGAGEPVSVVLLAALVLSCRVAPVTTHVRLLTVWSVVVVAVAVLVRLLAIVGGPWLVGSGDSVPLLGPLDVVESLLGLAPLLLALGTLTVLLRPTPAPDVDQPALAGRQPGQPAAGATAAIESSEPAPDPAWQPTWQPDQATGAAWLNAGDAASGRPPSAAAPTGDQDEPHPWASGPR